MPPRWEFYTHFDRDGYLNIREEPCFCFAFTFNQIEFCSEAKKSSPPFIRFSAIIYFVTILEDITRQEKNILKLNSKVENLTEKYRGEISDNKKKQWVSRMLWSNVFLKSHFDQHKQNFSVTTVSPRRSTGVAGTRLTAAQSVNRTTGTGENSVTWICPQVIVLKYWICILSSLLILLLNGLWAIIMDNHWKTLKASWIYVW